MYTFVFISSVLAGSHMKVRFGSFAEIADVMDAFINTLPSHLAESEPVLRQRESIRHLRSTNMVCFALTDQQQV
jgi:hypothetical protein